MKKKLFGIMLVFAVVLFAGYTAYNSHGDIKLSDVTLANLEALADENDDMIGRIGLEYKEKDEEIQIHRKTVEGNTAEWEQLVEVLIK